MNKILLEPHYLPNIQYFSKFLMYSCVIIDDLSIYEKQTFRNRCQILGANKVLDLIVPVHRGKSKIPLFQIKIDNSGNWQKNHWLSIESAYSKSPYYFYYKDYLKQYFGTKQLGLLSLDFQILKTLIELLNIDVRIELLSEQSKDETFCDFRNKIHPKPYRQVQDEQFRAQSYIQVFNDRYPFIPNLSILDLLFNMGNESIVILNSCIL